MFESILDTRYEDVQWIYVLSNPAYPDSVEIGEVHARGRRPEDRAKEESSRPDVKDPFSVEGAWPVWDSRLVEREVHDLLSEYRHRPNREIFNLSVDRAKEHISGYLRDHEMAVDRPGWLSFEILKPVADFTKEYVNFLSTEEGQDLPEEVRLVHIGWLIEVARWRYHNYLMVSRSLPMLIILDNKKHLPFWIIGKDSAGVFLRASCVTS
ncbi:GIY-YIG nuclease family protein [Sulfidibacter corallicola]|uniref:GIY-YIG nuclease family protein n=1 Tax=Sulfidibacter corallicola TaxID=2818388 RepID=A0A8A4TND3_SULCO|nr:GIY-YIG nuclease family protein [Sulfidibacter corallicola]QTD50714.1 GIY-YIG nuclease family protein [Sulfidibacter corallicola]